VILSKTNVAASATITDSPVSATQDIDVVSDGDYSSVYVAAMAGTMTTTFVYGVGQAIGYIAIAGNISQKTNIEIKFNTVSIVNKALNNNDSQVMVFKVDQTGITNVQVIVTGTGDIAIIEIAMGEYFTVPHNGEQAGYKRPWSVPNRESRGAKSLHSSPVALLYQAKTIKASLSIPNILMSDYDSYYDFLDFATASTFYVLEDDNELHSCAGFDAKAMETKAHGSTRLLGVSAISFNAYSKGLVL